MQGNTARIMAMAEKYSTPSTKPKKGATNPNRVTVGQVFMQPTKEGKNFKFCYYGMTDSDGSHITGFSMSNEKMLASVKANLLSESFLATFEAFADKFGESQQIM